MKRCPLCNEVKALDDFDKYFSKERQKYRVQSRCRECMKRDAKKRAHDYFIRNREKVLQYARDYRANPANKDKIRAVKSRIKKRWVAELRDSYVASEIAHRLKITVAEVKQTPGLIERQKDRIEIARLMRKYNKEHRR